MNILGKVESILFVASKPLSVAQIAKAVVVAEEKIEDVLETLLLKYNSDDSGINIIREGDKVQMASCPDNVEVVDGFVKDEVAGELTKAQLETLTVVAYRGPVTRPELEQIRGVNCSLILRNLLVRGLINIEDDKNKITPVYSLSFDALRHLGLREASDLPNYSDLHKHEHLEKILEHEG